VVYAALDLGMGQRVPDVLTERALRVPVGPMRVLKLEATELQRPLVACKSNFRVALGVLLAPKKNRVVASTALISPLNHLETTLLCQVHDVSDLSDIVKHHLQV
jgi:hypothetical protein